jgi:hypothetical protein
MTDAPDQKRPPTSVDVDEDGHRHVSWSVVDSAGKTVTFQHDYPDVLQHHYKPAAGDDAVPLYEGGFSFGDEAKPFQGDVRFSWHPSPRVVASGTRETTPADLARFMASDDQGMWIERSSVRIELRDDQLPPQPAALARSAPTRGYSIAERVEQDLGSSAPLDRVTFLIPNGWEALDATGICDPDDLLHLWDGRTHTSGGGWDVVIDRRAGMDSTLWRQLHDEDGWTFTHVGQIQRTDTALFSGEEAFDALDRIRVALNIALGRRTTCALPVGWSGYAPVWTRWRGAPVDRYTQSTHWLDDTIASKQVREIVSRVLDYSSDPLAWEALKPAVAYYMAANVDVDVELSVSIPVSALQLLAYHRFVTERGLYSNTAWKALDTEDQLRLLFDDIQADLTVQAHFQHLADARDRLALIGPPRDALGTVMKMRNTVTHPTRDKPATFSIYEWAEAGMHARYWLCLAILNTVGYQGMVADVLTPRARWTGQVRSVPWAPSQVGTISPTT